MTDTVLRGMGRIRMSSNRSKRSCKSGRHRTGDIATRGGHFSEFPSLTHSTRKSRLQLRRAVTVESRGDRKVTHAFFGPTRY
jgi:hypothetical protein